VLILREPFLVKGDLSNPTIVPDILPVHIAGHSPSKQGVVESGIELTYILTITAFHLDTTKHLIPSTGGFPVHLVKTMPGRFSFQVQAGIIQTGIGESHLHLHHFPFAGGEIQIETIPDSPGTGGIWHNYRITENAHCFGLFTQTGHKIHFYPVSWIAKLCILGVCFNITLNFPFTPKLRIGLCHIAALALLMTQVEDDTRAG